MRALAIAAGLLLLLAAFALAEEDEGERPVNAGPWTYECCLPPGNKQCMETKVRIKDSILIFTPDPAFKAHSFTCREAPGSEKFACFPTGLPWLCTRKDPV